jgi:hypothetical protein
MTTSQETIAMRATIWAALRPEELRAINFAALDNAAADAMDRGWTGVEIGKAAVQNLDGAHNVGAVMLTAIRDLGSFNPPREVTPTPPPIDQVRAEMYNRHPPASPQQASAWAARIRAELAPEPLTEDEREHAATLIGEQRAT